MIQYRVSIGPKNHPPRQSKAGLPKCSYTNVDNNQKVERTQMTISRQMGKENVVYPSIHVVEYYLVIKKMYVLIHAMT